MTNPPMRLPQEFPEGAFDEELDPTTDPSVAAWAENLVHQANAAEVVDEGAEEGPPLPFPATDALHVTLPVPLFHPIRNEEITTAEVRELNGEDEEYFDRGKNFFDRKRRMIERATVKLGEEDADPTTLNAITQGAREVILLAIRRATYGDELRVDVTCPKCNQEDERVVDLSEEVEITSYDTPKVELTLRSGREVEFRWPTGDDEQAIWKFWEKSKNASVAQLNTQMLTRVLESYDGEPALGEQTARRMNLADRKEIADHIASNGPGPDYEKLTHTCESCGHTARLGVTFDDLFR